MKKLLLVLCATIGLLTGCGDDENEPVIPQESEVTLFDKNAQPVAYINYVNKDSTIYMWDGTPVAYFDGKEDIYHFNGHFLGWYINGVLYDTDGYAVAAQKGIVRGEIIMSNTHLESVKGVKHIKPVPHIHSLKPITPSFKDKWSTCSLSRLLLQGDNTSTDSPIKENQY